MHRFIPFCFLGLALALAVGCEKKAPPPSTTQPKDAPGKIPTPPPPTVKPPAN
jgi:hypothetical protein